MIDPFSINRTGLPFGPGSLPGAFRGSRSLYWVVLTDRPARAKVLRVGVIPKPFSETASGPMPPSPYNERARL